jgi:hypothetical protein
MATTSTSSSCCSSWMLPFSCRRVTLSHDGLPTVRPKSTSSCSVTPESYKRSSSSSFSLSPTFCCQINEHLDCRARIPEDLHEAMLNKVF